MVSSLHLHKKPSSSLLICVSTGWVGSTAGRKMSHQLAVLCLRGGMSSSLRFRVPRYYDTV